MRACQAKAMSPAMARQRAKRSPTWLSTWAGTQRPADDRLHSHRWRGEVRGARWQVLEKMRSQFQPEGHTLASSSRCQLGELPSSSSTPSPRLPRLVVKQTEYLKYLLKTLVHFPSPPFLLCPHCTFPLLILYCLLPLLVYYFSLISSYCLYSFEFWLVLGGDHLKV